MVIKEIMMHSPKDRTSARSVLQGQMKSPSMRNENKNTRKMLGLKGSSGNKSPTLHVTKKSTLAI